jgi:glucan 1,3-beta-glucosidase
MVKSFGIVLLALSAFGSVSSHPTSKREAGSGYWYEDIEHNGISPFIPGGDDWVVFRNVKDYGAKGDGVTDDTDAIQAAINYGGRGNANVTLGTTGGPASVYFPEGTYLLDSSIQMYVDTVLIGNPINRPTIKASSKFQDYYLVRGWDPSWDSTINFYMGFKNFILDSSDVSLSSNLTLMDWSVSQATQLTNVLFNMPQSSNHTGVSTPEGGSGTYMGNIDFVGGAIGINMNNQQYSLKGISFSGCETGILISHGFDMVMQGLTFSNNGRAIDATAGDFGNVGSFTLIDSTVESVDIVIDTKTQNGTSGETVDDSIVLQNVQVINSGSTVVAGGKSILRGSVFGTWVYGNAYFAGGHTVHELGTEFVTPRSPVMLDNNGAFFTQAPPTYQDYSLDQVINIKSVKGLTVYGDGVHDDTANINTILSRYAGRALIFFPQGTYLVSDTINIPSGSQIVGEVWSAISGTGSAFSDASSPKVMIQIGQDGEVGSVQISDMLFTIAEVLPGCILLEIAMAGVSQGDVALWNSHFRVGGAFGSTATTSCDNPNSPCTPAFLMLHLTPSASVYIEDMWGWTADHDLDGNYDQTISTGRGALIESTKGTWLVGTAFEHNTLYQYSFNGASNLFIGMQQCETPYWQGIGGPAQAPAPWTPNSNYNDPTFSNCAEGDANCRMAWYAYVTGGSDLYVYGSGFWTFFNDVNTCLGVNGSCQDNAVAIYDNPTSLYWWNLNTRGVVNMVTENGQAVAIQDDNSGSWGGVLAAYLVNSGLFA